MKLLKTAVVVTILGSMIISSGCTSMLRYSYSKDEVLQQRIIASGDQQAINSLRMGAAPSAIRVTAVPGGAMVGMDLMDPAAWDVIMQHPWQQLGLGVLDAGMTYGAYKLGDNQGWWGNSSDSSSHQQTATSGRDSTQINVNGSGNNIHVDSSAPTTTSTEAAP